MDRSAKVALEGVAVAVLCLVAAGLRVASLDLRPLDPAEATLALQAAAATPQRSSFWGSDRAAPQDSGYTAPTSLLFQAAGAGDAAARVIPALAGTIAALLPLALRSQWGSGRSFVASLMLAVSPTMVATSRMAGAQSLALLGGALIFLALVPWPRPSPFPRHWVWVGAGFLLAAGRPGYTGLLTALLGAALATVASRGKAIVSIRRHASQFPSRGWWLTPALAIGVAAGGGLAGFALPGLFSSLGAWLQQWSGAAAYPWGPALLVLVAYEPLITVLAVAGIVSSSGEPPGGNRDDVRRDTDAVAWKRICGWWMLGGIIAVALFPGRQAADLIWILLPASFLAADSLAVLASRLQTILPPAGGTAGQRTGGGERSRPSGALAGLVGLLAVLAALGLFAALQLSAFARNQGPAAAPLTTGASLGLALGAIVMAVLIIFLFGAGWSLALAADGASVAGVGLAAALGLANLWHLNFVPAGGLAADPWRGHASGPGLPLLASTLRALSLAHSGRTDSMPIQFQSDPPPELAWALRRYPAFVAGIGPGSETAPVVLAREGDAPGLAADYLGQLTTVSERWVWSGVLPSDPITWLVLRQAPTLGDRWLLLVRADIASLGVAPLDSAR